MEIIQFDFGSYVISQDTNLPDYFEDDIHKSVQLLLQFTVLTLQIVVGITEIEYICRRKSWIYFSGDMRGDQPIRDILFRRYQRRSADQGYTLLRRYVRRSRVDMTFLGVEDINLYGTVHQPRNKE